MTHDHEEKVMEELIEMYVAPNRQDTVKECVVGKAEYQGTVRINASAIPLFRKVQSALRSHAAIVEAETVERCAMKIKELEESKREEYRECGGQMLQGEVFGLKSAAAAIRALQGKNEQV